MITSGKIPVRKFGGGGEDSKIQIRKAVLYARVSSSEQEQGYSILTQKNLLREHAAKNGFMIVEEFIEVETAKQAGRTQFNRMLAYLKKHPDVHAIPVEKTDRLYRNFPDYVKIDELDLEIHLVKEGAVLSKNFASHQRLVHEIKVVLARNYILNLSEETKKGIAEKVKQGGYPHPAPVGYRNDPTTRNLVPVP